MSISPDGGSWEKSLVNDAIWKGFKIFCPTGSVRRLDKASEDWVGFSAIVLEFEDNVFVLKEVRSWPGCLDPVDLIKCGLKEGWVCDICFTALAYELPPFSKSIETEMLYSQALEHYNSYL